MTDPIKEAEDILEEYSDNKFEPGKTFEVEMDDKLLHLTDEFRYAERLFDRVAERLGSADSTLWAYMEELFPDISNYHVTFDSKTSILTVLGRIR